MLKALLPLGTSNQIKPRRGVSITWRATLKVQCDHYKVFFLLLYPENHWVAEIYHRLKP